MFVSWRYAQILALERSFWITLYDETKRMHYLNWKNIESYGVRERLENRVFSLFLVQFP